MMPGQRTQSVPCCAERRLLLPTGNPAPGRRKPRGLTPRPHSARQVCQASSPSPHPSSANWMLRAALLPSEAKGLNAFVTVMPHTQVSSDLQFVTVYTTAMTQ